MFKVHLLTGKESDSENDKKIWNSSKNDYLIYTYLFYHIDVLFLLHRQYT